MDIYEYIDLLYAQQMTNTILVPYFGLVQCQHYNFQIGKKT